MVLFPAPSGPMSATLIMGRRPAPRRRPSAVPPIPSATPEHGWEAPPKGDRRLLLQKIACTEMRESAATRVPRCPAATAPLPLLRSPVLTTHPDLKERSGVAAH